MIGPGAEIERVRFNLKGRSPLVAHYLHMHQLRDNKPHGGKIIQRTEISKLPYPFLLFFNLKYLLLLPRVYFFEFVTSLTVHLSVHCQLLLISLLAIIYMLRLKYMLSGMHAAKLQIYRVQAGSH